MKINILTADIYNQIAAGEVVDRPYSVIKELVENALDAGASEVIVEVEGGGKSLIRVHDNGCGIEREDLANAYHPHATSKLARAEDLFGVTTLGFRGEALASIASVSEMNIVSRVEGKDAFSLACNFGTLEKVLPAAGAQGTEVTVKNLFANTPARLKFLKSDAQEEADAANMMARFILSRPAVSFTFSVGGKVKYRSFGDGLSAAVSAVYGASILDQLYEIDADKHGIRLYGFVGGRNYSKPNRTYQSLFVNGRYIVNQTVSAAVSNAYAGYLMKRQYPFYVLFLDVPPEIVDVNVHPNKADVRFADNQIIYGTVYSVVSSVLDGNSRALEYLVGAAPKQSEAPKPVQLPMTYAEAKKELAFDIPPVTGKGTIVSSRPAEPLTLSVHAPKPKEDYFEENKRFLAEQEKKARQQRVEPETLVFKGDLFRTYLFYECGDDAYIIDQHAAHERLLYDKLTAEIETKSVAVQQMLVPFSLTVTPSEYLFLEKNFGILREIGFEIEEFGQNSVKVSAVPSILMDINLSAFFAEVLTSLETLRAVRLSDILKDKLATSACKAAVKGGEQLTEQEARALIARMDGDMGLKCPHGRPVCVHIRKSEMDKLFKRIV